MQRTNESDITIAGIFRAGDPLRRVVQAYAGGTPYAVAFYGHIYEALGRAACPREGQNYLVTARPEAFEAGTVAAFETIFQADRVHFVVWQDRCRPFYALPETIRLGGLHYIETVEHLDAVIHSVAAVQQRRVVAAPILNGPALTLPNEPLTEDEMDALLGVGL